MSVEEGCDRTIALKGRETHVGLDLVALSVEEEGKVKGKEGKVAQMIAG
jgi:predicted RNA-binding protein YlqC (UPF0109 family)